MFDTRVAELDSATGCCKTDLDETSVLFKQLTPSQIKNYIDRDKPYDYAGGFRVEDLVIVLFESIEGNDSNALIGLRL